MVDEVSHVFDFTRVDSFLEDLNINYSINDMYKVTGVDSETGEYTYEDDTVGDNFQLVLVMYGGNNISDYLDSDGCLDDSITETLIETCGLDYYNKGNANASIELHDTVEFVIGNDTSIPLKAIFLRDLATGVVMGYSINLVSIPVTNKVIFDDDVIFWDITRYNNG